MKRFLLPILAICLLAACGSATDVEAPIVTEAPIVAEQEEAKLKIYPLPDSTMDNLSDCILAVSLEEGAAYVDDSGKMQMELKIYSYDKFDMVDISMLKVGDVLVTHAGEVEITSLERMADASLAVNGGLDAGGFSLVTENNGIFFERGYNDAKNWHEVGQVTIPVSENFVYYDNSDLELGETEYASDSLLRVEVLDYHFYPHNTTIRVENGQIVEMHRRYVP